MLIWCRIWWMPFLMTGIQEFDMASPTGNACSGRTQLSASASYMSEEGVLAS